MMPCSPSMARIAMLITAYQQPLNTYHIPQDIAHTDNLTLFRYVRKCIKSAKGRDSPQAARIIVDATYWLFGYILSRQTAYLVLMYYDSCLTFGRILEFLGITLNRQRLPNMDVRHVPLRQDVELEQCRVI